MRLSVAFTAHMGVLIEDGDVVNAYAHAKAKCTIIYLIVNDVYQFWYSERHVHDIPLGSGVLLLKAM
jgi:hypothetical protein